jgi:hypothetical protein
VTLDVQTASDGEKPSLFIPTEVLPLRRKSPCKLM